jgi:chemotaxis protein MotB
MAVAKGKAEIAPIIIKRVKKHAHGHHGGSWKVAFADFATAMMAFFLLLWLMGSTTPEQKGAISEYFNNPSAVPGASPTPSVNGINGPGGASTSLVTLGGGVELYRNAAPENTPTTEQNTEQAAAQQAADAAAEELDRERLDALLQELRQAIDQRESLAKFKDQILLDVTPEGVRIQIIDHERRSMFPLGSAALEPFTDNILHELATIIGTVPNRISISGHTDIRPYGRLNYSNWELSADRANAARRSLISGGLPADKVGRVVGLASSVLLDPAAPDSPINRRISIVVMNKRTEDAISHENGTLLSVQPAPGATAEAAEPMAAVDNR